MSFTNIFLIVGGVILVGTHTSTTSLKPLYLLGAA